MTWERVHRWLAIVLAVLLVAWSLTGLLFHVKPGWDRAYDLVSAERRDAPLPPGELAPPAAIRAVLGDAPLVRLELFGSALGPLYRATTTAGSVLIDATTGQRRSPLDEAAARTLVQDAVARSRHAGAYGAIAEISLDERAARVRFASGAIATIGRHDARISQRGSDTDRIDWLYRVHYLQWTGNATVDRVLALAGLALIWAVVIPGLVLFVRRARNR